MKWKDIGKMIAQNAPTIGVALGGPLGGSIGQLVSSVLGVPDEPAAVAQKLKEDPETFLKILALEKTHELEVMKAAYAAQQADQSILADIYKTELKSESWMARNWRPMFGMSVAVSFAIQMMGVTAVMLLSPKDAGEVINGMISLIPIWGVALSVLGINIDRRSEDKRNELAAKAGTKLPTQSKGIVEILGDFVSKSPKDKNGNAQTV
jgi:hypothetical protein